MDNNPAIRHALANRYVSALLAGHKRRKSRGNRVPDSLDELRYELAIANRILAHEGVLDAFGHVSVRHPDDPQRYLLSRSRGPELVEPADILEFNLESEPLRPPTARLYSERVIHGEIYKARPEVNSVCHHHAPAVLPYCISGEDIIPVFHLGAVIGTKAPFWDQRDEFGDTNLLVIKPEEGRSLARALGPHWVVLMRRHGATVAGISIRDTVFRSIYSCRNAEFQTQARALGGISPLSAGEIQKARGHNLQPGPVNRAWEYWTVRIEKRGEMPPRGKAAVRLRAAAARSKQRARRTKGRKGR
jgi:ribulose-5-phosphate 4-epimerase/fuculose-1-phosphate aldolase